jgi:hypothetical protein
MVKLWRKAKYFTIQYWVVKNGRFIQTTAGVPRGVVGHEVSASDWGIGKRREKQDTLNNTDDRRCHSTMQPPDS